MGAFKKRDKKRHKKSQNLSVQDNFKMSNTEQQSFGLDGGRADQHPLSPHVGSFFFSLIGMSFVNKLLHLLASGGVCMRVRVGVCM